MTPRMIYAISGPIVYIFSWLLIVITFMEWDLKRHLTKTYGDFIVATIVAAQFFRNPPKIYNRTCSRKHSSLKEWHACWRELQIEDPEP